MQKGFQENVSNASVINYNCTGNKTITIVKLRGQQSLKLCTEYTSLCNVTEEQKHAIKRDCRKENTTCAISMSYPNTSSCLFNDFGNVSNSYSCTGFDNYSQAFLTTDESKLLHGCSNMYSPQLNLTRIMFDQKFENCSAVNDDAQTSNVTACIDIENLVICTFNLSEMIWKDLNCFPSNRLMIEFKCKEKVPNVLSDLTQKKKVSIDIGAIVGMVVDVVLLTCLVLISCLIRRSGLCRKSNDNQEPVPNNRDNIVKQDATLPSVIDSKNKQKSHCNGTENNKNAKIYDSGTEEV
ncbi:uncharacterized protein [Mytilus edulis]|uniref:uncharacterized protein isoform X2 n=1 Tax=Mytilus edulis TaxID=6550 RepID=UPI0039EF14B7